MSTTTTITLLPTRYATDIMSNRPHRCPGCRQMAYWWKNRNGKTRCISCAEEGDGQPTQAWYADEAHDRAYRSTHGE